MKEHSIFPLDRDHILFNQFHSLSSHPYLYSSGDQTKSHVQYYILYFHHLKLPLLNTHARPYELFFNDQSYQEIQRIKT